MWSRMVTPTKTYKCRIMKPFATGNQIYSKNFKSQDTELLATEANVGDVDDDLNPVFFPIADVSVDGVYDYKESHKSQVRYYLPFREYGKGMNLLLWKA